jgi:hypothetical protein
VTRPGVALTLLLGGCHAILPVDAPPAKDAAVGPACTTSGDCPREEACVAGACVRWWNRSFARRIRLTLDNRGRGPLSNFPLLVVLNPQRLGADTTVSSGIDLRFVEPNGDVGPLHHEIERWAIAGVSWIWVLVPSIRADSNNHYIWLYFDNPQASDALNPKAVWSDYLGVWHLDGTNDAKGELNATNLGTIPAPGIIGNARAFSKDTKGHLTVAASDAVQTIERYTVSVWVKANSCQFFCGAFTRQLDDLVKKNDIWLGLEDGLVRASVYPLVAKSQKKLPAATWTWLGVTYDGGEAQLYVDGVPVTTALGGPPLAPNPKVLRIGADFDNGKVVARWDGALDEARIEALARQPDWMAAQYASMTDRMITYGPAERLQ